MLDAHLLFDEGHLSIIYVDFHLDKTVAVK